ncbi:CoA transferase [Sagittula salina]|uniref:CoA transferase n=1 Tax=Sagittula salina TaxID=2820268 RepID=A0A940S309_9RHOB|nr:CoA transferase [Sagittula salina]MBP0482539.1 CoA transferase [Sagittula salina]
MTGYFDEQIGAALEGGGAVAVSGAGELPSCFATSDLAVASVAAAAGQLARLTGEAAEVDRRRTLIWFSRTLRPEGWDLPSAWDSVAGDYRAADGWIRLHTNAPHHRTAALSVLGCAGESAAVAEAVTDWKAEALETAVVGAGGAAAAMHSLDGWAAHPQGRAVAVEPLIAWEDAGQGRGQGGLDGIRVLDLTRVLAGPVATRFLAGFGARVLRIDPPGWSEPGVEPEVTLGKRRAGLDLRRAEDRARFEALLRESDVLVHGYRPGALEGLGYGGEVRQRLAPACVDVSLNAYGWTGPWAGRRGFDSLVQMSCGIAAEGMARRGGEPAAGARPVPLPVQALDHATGYLMAAAVLRALRVRQEEGRVLSARLSLARSAALLTGAGARAFTGEPLEEGPQDLSPESEATGWGPARRVAFPGRLGGRGPRWAFPAGPLRCDPPDWP